MNAWQAEGIGEAGLEMGVFVMRAQKIFENQAGKGLCFVVSGALLDQAKNWGLTHIKRCGVIEI